MSEIVAKFGGTSMANPEIVANIVENNPEQRYIVVSAPGAPSIDALKVTEMLISRSTLSNSRSDAVKSLEDRIIARFDSAYSGLDQADRSTLKDKLYTGLKNSATPEQYQALGERFSSLYFARLIGGVAVDSPIVFTRQELDRDLTRSAITKMARRCIGERRKIIVPGFFGYEKESAIRLLQRGGSDRTAMLISASLGLDNENWTDVDGIYTANPKNIHTARQIPIITRSEVLEGAHGGSEVFQGDAIVDGDGVDFNIEVKNTFNPNGPSTQIVQERTLDSRYPVVAVSSRNLKTLDVHDLEMANKPGYLAKILDVVEDLGISIEHVPANHTSVMLTFSESEGKRGDMIHLEKEVRKGLIAMSGKVTLQNKAVVYVIGEALRNPVVAMAITGKTITALQDNNLAYLADISLPNSSSLAFLVDETERRDIERIAHDNLVVY